MFPLLVFLLLLFGPVCYTGAVAVNQTASHLPPLQSLLPPIAFFPQDHQPDNETIAAFSKSGICFVYLSHMFPDSYKEGWNRDKELEPCKTYCQQDDASNGYGVSPLLLPVF